LREPPMNQLTVDCKVNDYRVTNRDLRQTLRLAHRRYCSAEHSPARRN